MGEAGYESRVQGEYFGTFNGHNRYIHDYKDTRPFFTELSIAVSNATGAFINTIFVNPEIDGEGINDTGVILGSATFGTIIDNCHIIGGYVKGGENVGAIVGYTASNVSNCTVTGTEVTGSTRVGGIAGYIALTKKENEKKVETALAALGSNKLLFGQSTSSAKVTASAANGIAGGMVGKSSSDMDSELFSIEAYDVTFSGEVSGNTVGSIAGEIEIAQSKFGFHGIENSGTVIGTGTAPTIGGFVGIGRIISPNALTEESPAEPTLTSLALTGVALSNTGVIVTPSGSSVGGMIGKIELPSSVVTLTSTVQAAYETIENRLTVAGEAQEAKFIPFMGNAESLATDMAGRGGTISENFAATYLHPLPAASWGYPDGMFSDLSIVGLTVAVTGMNTALKDISPFSYDNSGKLVRP